MAESNVVIEYSSLPGNIPFYRQSPPTYSPRPGVSPAATPAAPAVAPAAGRYDAVVSGGVWTSGFGARVDPFNRNNLVGHLGTDIYAAPGTPVKAMAAGKVAAVSSGWGGGFGTSVDIDHGDGHTTRYAHMLPAGRKPMVVGQPVEKGQQIGRVGSTGLSTGPHLHYEVHVNGRPVDPEGAQARTAGLGVGKGAAPTFAAGTPVQPFDMEFPGAAQHQGNAHNLAAKATSQLYDSNIKIPNVLGGPSKEAAAPEWSPAAPAAPALTASAPAPLPKLPAHGKVETAELQSAMKRYGEVSRQKVDLGRSGHKSNGIDGVYGANTKRAEMQARQSLGIADDQTVSAPELTAQLRARTAALETNPVSTGIDASNPMTRMASRVSPDSEFMTAINGAGDAGQRFAVKEVPSGQTLPPPSVPHAQRGRGGVGGR